MSQKAYFSFEAFRFVEHKNQTVSTFYLHCVTRLCEVSSCSQLLPVSQQQQQVPLRAQTEFQDVTHRCSMIKSYIRSSFINCEQDCESGQRRKREVQYVSANATVTSPAIVVRKQSSGASSGQILIYLRHFSVIFGHDDHVYLCCL